MVRYTTVDDVGVAVNPMLVTGQVHGGVAQGIGQALYEGVSYDPEGQLLTASYQDYCVPRADDIPPIEVTLDDSAPCRTNPLGAKGCGESGAIGGPPCITNGVMDALSELGIKTSTTPLTPMKVWQAIREAKAARVMYRRRTNDRHSGWRQRSPRSSPADSGPDPGLRGISMCTAHSARMLAGMTLVPCPILLLPSGKL